MGLFNAYVPSAASGAFPTEAWIKAPTSGQPSPISLGTIDSTSPTLNCRMEPIDADRFIMFYRDGSQQPTVRIATKSGTPSAGTAVTVVASAVTHLQFLRRIKNTNFWLLGVNNDLYFINAGASGTTVISTQISSDAGDAGRAEAFSQNITDIVIADDGSHFVIMNEFNDGGTRSFVSALWTLNTSAPSCTYVARDVDATGSANAALQASGYLRGGKAYFIMNTGSDLTTAYVNAVTFTASTVSNSVNTLTVNVANTTSTLSFSRNQSRYVDIGDDLIMHSFSSTTGLSYIIDVSSTPALYSSVSWTAEFGSFPPFNSYATSQETLCVGASVSGTAFRHRNFKYAAPSRPLVTGLTSFSNCAGCYSNDLNWMACLYRDNTTDGYIAFLKNAAV